MTDIILLDDFVKEYQKELVGEDNTIRFLLHVISSKWVKNKNPLSFHTLLNSESGAGKDFVLQAVMKPLEPKDYAGFTRISSRALDYLFPKDIYSDASNSWDNKFLGLQDIESDILNSSTLKVFLSDGSQTAIVTDKGIQTTKSKGRPVLLMTSAYSDPNKELMRRINIINLDETDAQTALILKRQACINNTKINNKKLQAVYNSFKKYDVRIDYAFKIAERLGSHGTHMRTFFPRFLDFIKASCVLHQNDRVVKESRIYANEEDYNNVKALFEGLSLTLSFNPLSRGKKEILSTLTYEFEGDWFTTKQASFIINQSYQAMFKNIKQFLEDGLVESKIERQESGCKPVYYYKPIEAKKLILPTFKELMSDE